MFNVRLSEKGLEKIQNARQNRFYINFEEFGLSSSYGLFSPSVDLQTIEALWGRYPLSGGAVFINPSTMELLCSIPANALDTNNQVITEEKQIAHIYFFATDEGSTFTVDLTNNEIIISNNDFYNDLETGDCLKFSSTGILPLALPINITSSDLFYVIKSSVNRIKIARTYADALNSNAMTLTTVGSGIHTIKEYFLLIVSKADPAYFYSPEGETKLRPQITINNIINNEVFSFSYTQAQEIDDHNKDLNAHPAIQNKLNLSGIFIQDNTFAYKGQFFFKNAVFDNAVTDKKPVYRNSNNNKFYLGKAVTNYDEIIGFSNIIDSTVIISGIIDIGHSFAVNTDLYLSNTNFGEITDSPTSVYLGKSLGNGLILFKQQSSSNGGGGFLKTLSDTQISNTIDDKSVLIFDENLGKWKDSLLSFSNLSDYDDTGINEGSGLIYTNGKWTATALTFSNLDDVQISSLSTNDFLIFNGTKFINKPFGLNFVRNTTDLEGISRVELGSGFSISEISSGVISLNFAGGGSGVTDLTDLADVDSSYPSNKAGVLLFDNKTANTNPQKVKLTITSMLDSTSVDYDSKLRDIFLLRNGGDSGIIGYGNYLSLESLAITFPNAPIDNGIYTLFLNKTSDNIGENVISWGVPFIMGQGASITNLNSENAIGKIVFSTGLGGSYNSSTGILTLTSTGGGGILDVTNSASSLNSRPLVIGTTSGISYVRGLRAGSNISIEMLDFLGNPTNNISVAHVFRLNSLVNVSNIGTTASGTETSNGVYTALKNSNDGLAVLARGIKGKNGITIHLETNGSSENIVIKATGGGGLSANTSLNISTGEYGIFISSSSNSNTNGFWSSGCQNNFYANSGLYGFYADSLTTAGFGVGNSRVGVALLNSNQAHAYFEPYSSGAFTNTMANLAPVGAFIFAWSTGNNTLCPLYKISDLGGSGGTWRNLVNPTSSIITSFPFNYP